MTPRTVSTARRLERALQAATAARAALSAIDLNGIERPELLVAYASSVKATADVVDSLAAAVEAERRQRERA